MIHSREKDLDAGIAPYSLRLGVTSQAGFKSVGVSRVFGGGEGPQPSESRGKAPGRSVKMESGLICPPLVCGARPESFRSPHAHNRMLDDPSSLTIRVQRDCTIAVQRE